MLRVEVVSFGYIQIRNYLLASRVSQLLGVDRDLVIELRLRRLLEEIS